MCLSFVLLVAFVMVGVVCCMTRSVVVALLLAVSSEVASTQFIEYL